MPLPKISVLYLLTQDNHEVTGEKKMWTNHLPSGPYVLLCIMREFD